MTNFSSNDQDVIGKCINVKEGLSTDIIVDCGIELQRCVEWIIENKYKRVCLQLPDELLCDAWQVANYFKKHTHSSIFILADTSYSSCCIDATAAAHVEADSLIHFGAACLSPHFGLPVFYVFETKQLDLPACLEAIRSVAVKKTLLFYDTKYHNKLSEIKGGLKSFENVFICEIAACELNGLLFGRKVPKTNYERAIYLGPESMLLTNLTLIFPNLEWFHYKNELQPLALNTSKFLMKRLHLVEKLKDVSVVGVLIGTLSIAGSLQAVDRIKNLCKSSGKKCYTVAVGRPNVAKLANLPEIEAYVLVACPENHLFIEFGDFYQPILSMIEVELALGSKPWSTDYTFDFRHLQLGGRMACTSVPESVLPSSDVSLITGKARNTAGHLNNTSNASALVLKESGAMVESRAAEFLLQRTWGGLEQKLGETEVLCLHGYRQDADKFRQQTGALRKMLKKIADFEFISAPHEVAGEGPTSRSWWFTQPQSFSSRDNSKMCLGLDESLMLIEKVWLDKGPFHGLLGFSQGACLVGILAAMINKKQVSISPRFLVLISGFISQSIPHRLFYTEQINLPSLHIFGEGDEVIPWEWSETLSQKFCNPVILKHPGGHFVGGTSTNKTDYQIFFKQQLDKISTID